MRGYTLTNVLDPAEAQDVATKEYADKMVNNVGTYVDIKNAYFTKLLDHVKKSIDERSHIIAVHTHYYGNLIKGKHQFTFGGNESHPALTGFLMPHSGRIEKITSRVEGIILITGSLFSFLLTKKEDKTKTRLANCICELEHDINNEASGKWV